jgi:predicted amino acid racemase
MSGVVPDDQKMGELSGLADAIESEFGLHLETVSGGNSANLPWLFAGGDVGRVNDLRIGEALLLGHEPVHHRPIPGLHADAITLVAEVIESKRKPPQPWGALGDTPYERRLWPERKGDIQQAVLALGEQDTDQRGLRPPPGIDLLGASSDHLVVHCTDRHLAVGDTVRFALDYRAMVRAMYSPFVAKTYALTRVTTDE